MKKLFFFLAFIIIIENNCIAQNTIGLPDVINYTKLSYAAGAQNRQIRQDKKGIMYLANSEALLTFDGIHWKTYPLPNKSIVRCVEFGPDDKLYIGGQDEFGYFSPDKTGRLVYISMKSLIPEQERSFTDVWEIYFYHGSIFFQTSSKIFQVTGKQCTIYKSVHWRFISTYNDRLIAQDFNKGLVTFENGRWKPFMQDSDLPKDDFVTSLTNIGYDSAMLTTLKNGIFLLTGTRAQKLRSAFLDGLAKMNISASSMVNTEHIALATNLSGCYIIDKAGNLIQNFSRKEGLQNNNILDIFLDKERNLWLGLDNGVDFIAYNNAIKHIYPDYFNEGSGYAAAIYHNDLFIGTSNGLYKTPLNNENETDLSYVKGSFSPIANSKGQVWNLSEVNDRLLMGHNDGAFVIENDIAKLLDKSTGFWTFQAFPGNYPASLMIAGTYNGITFYNYQAGAFINRNTSAIFESARFLCADDQSIWVAHPYKGIYRLIMHDGMVTHIKIYKEANGVLSPNGNYIFKINDKIILATENGIFEYNTNKDHFEPSAFYNNLFPKKNVRYLKQDAAGNIWFVFDKILGVVDMSTDKPQVIYFPELANKFVSGFEFIYPANNSNVFIGGEKGFYHVNLELYKKIKYPIQALITSVKSITKSDSVLFGGYIVNANEEEGLTSKRKSEISHSWNSFRFEFASPIYAQQSTIEYSYYLDGFDKTWSEFSRKTEKEYTNLPAGSYTFKVKARNNLGNESAITSYRIVVLPPWYQTLWAYMLYMLIILFCIYRIYLHQKRKFIAQSKSHAEDQKKLLYLHQLELEKTEKEIVKLRNEKLEAEIAHKNTELASVAMHLVQKGEILGKIKDQMVKLKKQPDNDSEDLKKIIKAISEEDKVDKQWEQFAMHFDNVHSDFLSTLKQMYQNLSPNELKLSAYLRMNMSTKEIAQLMNISVRGVEISRYRLRKKLQIPTEMSLFDFLIAIKDKHKLE